MSTCLEVPVLTSPAYRLRLSQSWEAAMEAIHDALESAVFGALAQQATTNFNARNSQTAVLGLFRSHACRVDSANRAV